RLAGAVVVNAGVLRRHEILLDQLCAGGNCSIKFHHPIVRRRHCNDCPPGVRSHTPDSRFDETNAINFGQSLSQARQNKSKGGPNRTSPETPASAPSERAIAMNDGPPPKRHFSGSAHSAVNPNLG